MFSIIIPAHNEETLLGETVRTLTESAARVEAALGETWEIIVADDASTDRTAAIARARGARLVSIDRRQISVARNAGASIAQGAYLVFVDADTLVPEAPLRRAIEAMKNGAVGGGALIRFDGRIPLWAALLLALSIQLYFIFKLASGSFIFCTHEAFDAVGGFDEAIYAGEEIYMSRALRRRGRFVVLRDRVITSARKLRDHSAGEILGALLSIGIRGRKGLENRHLRAFDLWYRQRRSDRGKDGL